MTLFLLGEKERLGKDFEPALIAVMEDICESWGDEDKAYSVGRVCLDLNLTLDTFKECQEIVRQWSGFYKEGREW